MEKMGANNVNPFERSNDVAAKALGEDALAQAERTLAESGLELELTPEEQETVYKVIQSVDESAPDQILTGEKVAWPQREINRATLENAAAPAPAEKLLSHEPIAPPAPILVNQGPLEQTGRNAFTPGPKRAPVVVQPKKSFFGRLFGG
jgi:hypothetical protein